MLMGLMYSNLSVEINRKAIGTILAERLVSRSARLNPISKSGLANCWTLLGFNDFQQEPNNWRCDVLRSERLRCSRQILPIQIFRPPAE